MLKVKDLKVSALSSDSVLIAWKIEPTKENVANFEFRVQRALDQSFSEIDFTSDLVTNNIYQYTNTGLSMGSQWRIYVWRIQVRDITTTDVAYSDIVYLAERPDIYLLEIARRHKLILDTYVGKDVLYYIHKSIGTKCSCFDELKQRGNRSDCPDCFGLTVVGGFYSPITTRVNFNQRSKIVNLQSFAETEPNETSVYMPNYPRATPRDLIVEPVKNKRWTVMSVALTHNDFITHQKIGVHEVNINDVEYTMALP